MRATPRRTSRALRRGRGSAASVAALLAASFTLATLAPGASADVDTVPCNNYVSAQSCYLGSGYRGYIQVTSGTLDGATARSEWCAKAVTAAGNIKGGSGCNYNAVSRKSCLDNVSPNSVGYSYWAGTGYPLLVVTEGRTPTSTNC